jgi:signal transduction histidine kinase
VTHIILVGSLWTIMATFALPTDNARFTSEALIASFTTSVVLVVSGTVLFKTTVEAFRQQKIVEEERNTISRLNLETEALNQELFHRQDILEEQAREIEIINTQLQEQNQTLFDLNIEKNELMEIVAHDLKNPIGAVRSFAELMQEGYVLPEDIPSTSEKIAQTANRMLDLVTNLLDINRLESGAAQFTIVKIDTLPIVKTIVENYRSQAAQKNISIYLASETAQTRVLADEQALQQVLDNILSNAVKYSPHGKNVFVRIKASIDAVRVEIQDEGEGISPDDMKKLFGKFARLTARPTGGEHSTGLGLSIVKKMMEAMNGKVWCESEVGDGLPTGATFIVELPMATT